MSFATSVFNSTNRARAQHFASVPGPPPLPLLGNAGEFLFAKCPPWQTFQRLAAEHGDMVLLWLGRSPAILLHDPALIAEVFVHQRERFYKKSPCDALRPLSSDSNAFIANGEHWVRVRGDNPMSRAEFPAWLDAKSAQVADHASSWISAAGRSENAPADAVQRMVFDTMSLLTVGRVFDDSAYPRFLRLADVIDRRMRTGFPPILGRFRLERARWLSLFRSGRRAVRARNPEGSLAQATFGDSTLSDRDMVYELANVFPGGLFSVSSTVANALCLLASRAELQETLRAQLADLALPGGRLPLASLATCPLLEGVVRETLRLYPPAPLTSRNVGSAPVTLGGVELAPDTTIFVSNLPLHLRPEIWEDPTEFRPERWTPALLSHHDWGSDYFFPFGRGPRSCMGQQMALMIIRSVLAQTLRQAKLSPAASGIPGHRYYFGCMMPLGFPVRIEVR